MMAEGRGRKSSRRLSRKRLLRDRRTHIPPLSLRRRPTPRRSSSMHTLTATRLSILPKRLLSAPILTTVTTATTATATSLSFAGRRARARDPRLAAARFAPRSVLWSASWYTARALSTTNTTLCAPSAWKTDSWWSTRSAWSACTATSRRASKRTRKVGSQSACRRDKGSLPDADVFLVLSRC